MFYVIKVNYYELKNDERFEFCESYVCGDAFESMASAVNYLNENGAELMPSGKYVRYEYDGRFGCKYVYEIVSVDLNKED